MLVLKLAQRLVDGAGQTDVEAAMRERCHVAFGAVCSFALTSTHDYAPTVQADVEDAREVCWLGARRARSSCGAKLPARTRRADDARRGVPPRGAFLAQRLLSLVLQKSSHYTHFFFARLEAKKWQRGPKF